MKIRLMMLSFMVSVFLTHGPARAQDGGESMVGTWTMTDTIGRSWSAGLFTMDSIGSVEYEIVEHNGPIILGVSRWQLQTDDLNLDDGVAVTQIAEEEFMGVEGFDGTYIIVEAKDNSVRQLKRVDANTFESILYESGEFGFVAMSTFKRQ